MATLIRPFGSTIKATVQTQIANRNRRAIEALRSLEIAGGPHLFPDLKLHFHHQRFIRVRPGSASGIVAFIHTRHMASVRTGCSTALLTEAGALRQKKQKQVSGRGTFRVSSA
jgi:hypothetical protein